jgi:hypothetical protein
MRAMIEAHHPGGSVKLDKTYNEEMLKCNKNPECNVSGYHQEGAGHAELAAVRLAVAKTTALGHLLVIKEQGSHNPATRVAMHEMGAYPVVGYRSNVLARMLCEAKDCFAHKPDNDAEIAQNLTKLVGPNQDACFPTRRELPPEEQPQVWVDVQGGKLLETLMLYDKEEERMKEHLGEAGYGPKDYAVVTLEQLFESEGDGSDAALMRTVAAWEVTLSSLGVAPDPKLIESVLEPQRGERPVTSNYDSISNADEVEAALASDHRYAAMASHMSPALQLDLADLGDGGF